MCGLCWPDVPLHLIPASNNSDYLIALILIIIFSPCLLFETGSFRNTLSTWLRFFLLTVIKTILVSNAKNISSFLDFIFSLCQSQCLWSRTIPFFQPIGFYGTNFLRRIRSLLWQFLESGLFSVFRLSQPDTAHQHPSFEALLIGKKLFTPAPTGTHVLNRRYLTSTQF